MVTLDSRPTLFASAELQMDCRRVQKQVLVFGCNFQFHWKLLLDASVGPSDAHRVKKSGLLAQCNLEEASRLSQEGLAVHLVPPQRMKWVAALGNFRVTVLEPNM